MTDPRSFAAHLAAVARVPDPEDRAVARLLGSVVLDWTQLSLGADPRFELDGATFWLANQPFTLPAPWRDALRGLEGALRAHGVGGVRLAGSVDRGTVIALLRGARAIPPSAPRDELQRWVTGHGGASLQLLPPRAATPRDARAALTDAVRAWSVFAAATELDRAALAAPLRALVERAEADPRALPVALAFAGPRPHRRAACVASWSLVLGLGLGLGRPALTDLVHAALDATALPAGVAGDVLARAVAHRLPARAGRADARAAVTLWGIRPDGPRHPHLFARIVALADELDGLLRGEGGRRSLPEEAIARLQAQAGRRHDPALVRVLLSIVGRWPVGTAALLDSGELVVVCRTPSTPEHMARPVVRVVADRSGTLLAGGPLLDLSAPERSRSRIVASVDPSRFGIDIASAVLG